MREERVVSIAAVAVAIAALVVSVYTAFLEREHQRLSVKPRMQISFYYNDVGAGWTLSNLGIGPAHVVWSEALVDGVAQPHWPGVTAAMRIKSNAAFEFTVPNPGSFQSAGATAPLMFARDPVLRQELIDGRARLNFRICFCSLYDECWLTESKEHGADEVRSCEPQPSIPFGSPPA